MEKQNKQQTTEEAVNQTSNDVWPNGREFLIEVYDLSIDDSTGKMMPQRVSYEQPVTIKAFSKAELNGKLALYRQCDQLAKIIKEITPVNAKQQQTSTNQFQNNAFNKQSLVNASISSVENSMPKNERVEQHISPQYFKIGDIEIKIENGKSYQKQFVKLTDSESKNIRVVDDKSNRTINLNGKHIEMKKWIQVQSSNIDEVSELENQLS